MIAGGNAPGSSFKILPTLKGSRVWVGCDPFRVTLNSCLFPGALPPAIAFDPCGVVALIH
jgi:hypothetical protein